MILYWWQIPIISGGQQLPPVDDPAVRALIDEAGGPIPTAIRQTQARLTAVLQAMGMNLSQEQRNEARQRIAALFRGIDPEEVANVLSRLTDAVLQNIVQVSIRTVAQQQEREQGRLFGSAFQSNILQPITNAKESARIGGDLTAAAGYSLLLSDIEEDLPEIEKNYFQYWLGNRPQTGPEVFDQYAPTEYLLSWWPQWSRQAIRNGADLGLASSYETIGDAVQGLINAGTRLGQIAKQNVDKMETDLNTLRNSLADRPELKALMGILSSVAATIVKEYAQVATRYAPGDYLNQSLPRQLQIALAGRPEAVAIAVGDAGATISGLTDAFVASREAEKEKERTEAQARIAAISKELSLLYPSITGTIQETLGNIDVLEKEADELGITLDDLVRQKQLKLQETGELDKKLEGEGVETAFRQKLAGIRAQQGDIKTDVDTLLSELEREHGAVSRQEQFESQFARTGAINEATLMERESTNQSRESLRNLDTEQDSALIALQQEEEEAVKQAIAGTPPNRIRMERERAVRDQFARKSQALARQFDKRRKEAERNLDVRLQEIDASIKSRLAGLETSGFKRSEGLKATFGQKATLLERELVARMQQLRASEAAAVQARDADKLRQLEAEKQAIVATISRQEKQLTLEQQAMPIARGPVAITPSPDFRPGVTDSQGNPLPAIMPTPTAPTQAMPTPAAPAQTPIAPTALTPEQQAMPLARGPEGVSAASLPPVSPTLVAPTTLDFGNDPFAQALLAAGVPVERVKTLLVNY